MMLISETSANHKTSQASFTDSWNARVSVAGDEKVHLLLCAIFTSYKEEGLS